MISYNIVRKKPVVEEATPPTNGIFHQIGQMHQDVDYSKKGEVTSQTMHPVGMGKIEYARWLGVHVYPKFPKGTKVTLSTFPFVIGAAPKMWFDVIEIQELHYCVQYDRHARQPKCVGICNTEFGSSFPVYYPPALLRVCQPEEVAAIDRLRNSPRSERKPEDAGLDGSESTVDRSTGEAT